MRAFRTSAKKNCIKETYISILSFLFSECTFQDPPEKKKLNVWISVTGRLVEERPGLKTKKLRWDTRLLWLRIRPYTQWLKSCFSPPERQIMR